MSAFQEDGESLFGGTGDSVLSSPPRKLPTPSLTPGSGRREAIFSAHRVERYSDRFIPSRTATNLEEALDLLDSKHGGKDVSESHENQTLMNSLLRSELLGFGEASPDRRSHEPTLGSPPRKESSSSVLKYRPSSGSVGVLNDGPEPTTSPGRLTFGSATAKSTASVRKISRKPFKTLDAPSLQDDYYLNLVDWSQSNVLAVALGNCVYMWSACTSKATKLCELDNEVVTSIAWARTGNFMSVGTSTGKINLWDCTTCTQVRGFQSHESRVGCMAWTHELLASGSRDRNIFIQDARIRTASDSSRRSARAGGPESFDTSLSDEATVDALSNLSRAMLPEGVDGGVATPPASSPLLGSHFYRPTSVLVPPTSVSTNLAPLFQSNPASSQPSIVKVFSGHRQEVCGLKWAPDDKLLASGGNDNKLFVWDPSGGNEVGAPGSRVHAPLHRFEEHMAAVKAVAWSPHQHGLLASGGGTADRHIRFWNASTGTSLHKIDSQSQVCNLMWAKNVNEIVSTHGYSLNQVIVWRYPSMQKVATLSGHTMRVLYLAMSPDGQTIVTGAGDETLRFWNIFPGPKSKVDLLAGQCALSPSPSDAR